MSSVCEDILSVPLSDCVISVYGPMKAQSLLAQNVEALLKSRGLKQVDLANWCRKSEVWVSQFLGGKRSWKIKDLDRIADCFGVATYQLFQPGISTLTDRRRRDRRSGRERRQSFAQRSMLPVGEHIAAFRPGAQQSTPPAAAATVLSDEIRTSLDAMRRDIDAILAGEQTPAAGRALAAARPRRRAPRRPDPEKMEDPPDSKTKGWPKE